MNLCETCGLQWDSKFNNAITACPACEVIQLKAALDHCGIPSSRNGAQLSVVQRVDDVLGLTTAARQFIEETTHFWRHGVGAKTVVAIALSRSGLRPAVEQMFHERSDAGSICCVEGPDIGEARMTVEGDVLTGRQVMAVRVILCGLLMDDEWFDGFGELGGAYRAAMSEVASLLVNSGNSPERLAVRRAWMRQHD